MQLTGPLVALSLLTTAHAIPSSLIFSRATDSTTDTAAVSAALAKLGLSATAISFGRIKPLGASNLCLATTGRDYLTPIVVTTCSSSLTQQWGIINTKGSTSYQFQNLDSGYCAQVNYEPFAGETVTIAPCTNSDGSGDPVSNTLWDSGTSLSVTPTAVNFLKTRIHFKTQDWCMDTNGANVVIYKCSPGSVSQKWLVGVA